MILNAKGDTESVVEGRRTCPVHAISVRHLQSPLTMLQSADGFSTSSVTVRGEELSAAEMPLHESSRGDE